MMHQNGFYIIHFDMLRIFGLYVQNYDTIIRNNLTESAYPMKFNFFVKLVVHSFENHNIIV